MERIIQRIEEHEKIAEIMKGECSEKIKKIAEEIIKCYKNENKVVIFGNGGSWADSSPNAGWLVGRFCLNRKSLPAISLSDSTNITAIGNDFGYEFVFEKQIEGIANKGDVVIGISTSGNSVNVIKGIEKAKEKGALTVSFTGAGGRLKDISDISLCIPSKNTPRIQEGYMLSAHIICEIVEDKLFGSG